MRTRQKKPTQIWKNAGIVLLMLLILFAAGAAAYAAPLPQTRENPDKKPDTLDFSAYTKKLPREDALALIVREAKSGNCRAAGYLAGFLWEKNIRDADGHDSSYWLLYAAKCGDIPSKIELGHPEYTTTTAARCGKTRLEILTFCNPLDRKIGYPICPKQILSFYDENNKLLRKYTALNRPIYETEDGVIIWAIFCTEVKGRKYYYAESADSGVSCCSWGDVFDEQGRYVGSSSKRTSFLLKRKPLPKWLGQKLLRGYEIWNHDWDATETEIEQYPKFR